MMEIMMKLINIVSSIAEISCITFFLFIDGSSGIEMINKAGVDVHYKIEFLLY